MGLGVQLRGDSVEKGKHIQEKMESNLAMALERVEALSKHLTITIRACKGGNQCFLSLKPTNFRRIIPSSCIRRLHPSTNHALLSHARPPGLTYSVALADNE